MPQRALSGDAAQAVPDSLFLAFLFLQVFSLMPRAGRNVGRLAFLDADYEAGITSRAAHMRIADAGVAANAAFIGVAALAAPNMKLSAGIA
ncbi:hypothetical protein SBA3_3290014 [Candidatus Sulfopaludibacter sp. SbA3]|nr:hypothetical protein SBA3_3290014 [Candidatus Sulfopaludibacter sp. SbA3]